MLGEDGVAYSRRGGHVVQPCESVCIGGTHD